MHADDLAATSTSSLAGTGEAREDHVRLRRHLARLARATSATGGLLFLLGVALHPARDGHSIATVGEVYGVTHALLAYGLLLQATSLVSLGLLGGRRLDASGVASILTASAGTLLWFGLIVMDGTRNPVTAQHSPDLVHTPADLELGVAMIVLPALVCFPLGYMLFARMLAQSAARLPALLVGVGCLVFWVGGLAIFAVGPHSPVIQVLEVAGALPYGLGVALGIRTLTEDQRVPDD